MSVMSTQGSALSDPAGAEMLAPLQLGGAPEFMIAPPFEFGARPSLSNLPHAVNRSRPLSDSPRFRVELGSVTTPERGAGTGHPNPNFEPESTRAANHPAGGPDPARFAAGRPLSRDRR